MKRKKEDNESENYYTPPPCLPSQLNRQRSLGSTGLLRRSLSENITPNKGFKKPRMLSDSGTPLSTRSNLISPTNSSVSTKVIVKPPIVKPIHVTPMEEEIISNTLTSQDGQNDLKTRKSLPKVLLQDLPKVIPQDLPKDLPQNLPAQSPQKLSRIGKLPQQLIQSSTYCHVHIIPQSQHQKEPKHEASLKPKQEASIRSTQEASLKPKQEQKHQKKLLQEPSNFSQLDEIKLKETKSISLTQIQPPSSMEEENEVKVEPIASGFKLASNKVIFLNHSAQQRIAFLTKQLQDMDIDLSEFKADVKKNAQSQPIACPMKDISNVAKSGNNHDIEDDFCDAADDEFLRNLDVGNLVGRESDNSTF